MLETNDNKLVSNNNFYIMHNNKCGFIEITTLYFVFSETLKH